MHLNLHCSAPRLSRIALGGWGGYRARPSRSIAACPREDLRSGCETGNADAVLDGDLDQFVEPDLLGVRRKDRNVSDDD